MDESLGTKAKGTGCLAYEFLKTETFISFSVLEFNISSFQL